MSTLTSQFRAQRTLQTGRSSGKVSGAPGPATREPQIRTTEGDAVPNDQTLRAGDSDREDAVAQLREHYAAGRLTHEEFDERSTAAYQARTFGDLSALTTDLPNAPLVRAQPADQPAGDPAPAGPAPAPAPTSRRHANVAAWGSWLSTALVLSAIWLISSLSSGHLTYFWPGWVIGPMAALVLARTITGSNKDPNKSDGS